MNATKIYQFTLVLKNVDENTGDLEDSLYESGCDDALINFKNGAVYLEFDREASSLEEAVVSAIKDVQSSSLEADVSSVAPENFVTESEIATRLQLSRQIVSLWIKKKRRKSFPHPVMRLSEKSPLWKWNEVCVWLYENKIIKDKEIVESALFFTNINAALEERDSRAREIRRHLLERISTL
jgi:predicted DNA-binding transcriptional regulator AlpA